MSELGARCGPGGPHEEHDRQHAPDAESEAQGQKSEGRRVLKRDLGGKVSGAPHDDEIPGEERLEPAALGKRYRQVRGAVRVVGGTGPVKYTLPPRKPA